MLRCLAISLALLTFAQLRAATVGFTNEADYLAAIAGLSYSPIFESFEDDAAWGSVRSTIVGGLHTAPSITSQSVTWTSNNSVSEITTGEGPARTGNWGFFSYPHGDYQNGTADGFRAASLHPLFAFGGWIETNTPFASVNFLLDDAVLIDFENVVIGTEAQFLGVVDTLGFHSVTVFETEGTIDDQKYIFADDFAIAGPALTGDYNQDGFIDVADYVVWRKGLGTTYTQDDYYVWRAHFGQTAAIGKGTIVPVVPGNRVPEPALLAILLVAVAGLSMSRGWLAAKDRC